jgi:hypothetical protein
MNRDRDCQTFSTSDIYLASALKISGFKMLDLKMNGNRRGTFIFEDKPERPQYVRDYFSGELTGSLKDFSNAWSDLKSLVSEMETEKHESRW